MRINLVTPFSEKDAAKALGARWDAGKKCWYIIDVADLTPFARWIPDIAVATGGSGGTPQMTEPKDSPPTPGKAPATLVTDVSDCGCEVLPWNDCLHTAKP